MKNSFRFKWSLKLSVKYSKKVILLADMLSRYKIIDDKLIWDHWLIMMFSTLRKRYYPGTILIWTLKENDKSKYVYVKI